MLSCHHRDGNHFNNQPSNIVTLCHNHHALADYEIKQGRIAQGLPMVRYEQDPNDLSRYFQPKGKPRGWQVAGRSNPTRRDPYTNLFVKNHPDDDEEEADPFNTLVGGMYEHESADADRYLSQQIRGERWNRQD
jgi:hypothetical protein